MKRLRLGLALALSLAPTLLVGPIDRRPSADLQARESEPRIAVDARPIVDFRPSEPGRARFGALEFVGGLVLSSRDRRFGGLSALRTRDHGRELLAVTDEGSWFTARLETDAAGRPARVIDARIAPLRDERGHPLRGKRHIDAEGLTFHDGAGGVEVLVGFERDHRVLAYAAPTLPDLLDAPGRRLAGLPSAIRDLRSNEGPEAIAEHPSGAPLILIAETARHGTDRIPAWIVGGPRPGAFELVSPDGFAATDAAHLPNGDLLVLQRAVHFPFRVKMRLVRIAAAELRPGAVVAGEELLAADGSHEIDNMEGLAVDTAPDGSTVLTLVSDDNFSSLQRTLLLRFRLPPTR